MNQRCSDPACHSFKNYGGRGITVCDRWNPKITLTAFENFLEDMGEGKIGWLLERIRNNEGYELWNCCWATRVHQARNKRSNLVFTVRGVTNCLKPLCEHFGIHYKAVWARLKRGMAIEQALFGHFRASPSKAVGAPVTPLG